MGQTVGCHRCCSSRELSTHHQNEARAVHSRPAGGLSSTHACGRLPGCSQRVPAATSSPDCCRSWPIWWCRHSAAGVGVLARHCVGAAWVGCQQVCGHRLVRLHPSRRRQVFHPPGHRASTPGYSSRLFGATRTRTGLICAAGAVPTCVVGSQRVSVRMLWFETL